MKYLGIDYGEKRIGLAFGDDQVKIATPFMVLENKGLDKVLPELVEIFEQEGIEQIVVGVPYSLGEKRDGAGGQEQAVLDFISRLGAGTIIPIARQDERFTTAQVDKLMAGEKYNKRNRDAIAAMLILQGYLDKL
ncbi:Holliday junction resolvase RuvX [Patescibacteria group bacterium]|nr:Holliday junction resolvase RuvX [Patescibacteria group bacterium]MBU1922066.1 Holliday junction resolvase RuvX [Patescibacteria group bacterium]